MVSNQKSGPDLRWFHVWWGADVGPDMQEMKTTNVCHSGCATEMLLMMKLIPDLTNQIRPGDHQVTDQVAECQETDLDSVDSETAVLAEDPAATHKAEEDRTGEDKQHPSSEHRHHLLPLCVVFFTEYYIKFK